MLIQSKTSKFLCLIVYYLIVSLCVTEFCFATSPFLDCIGQLFGFADKFQKYLNTFQGTHFYFMYLYIMVILALDRFLEFRFACLLPISDKMYNYRKYLIA